jgi:lysozyme
MEQLPLTHLSVSKILSVARPLIKRFEGFRERPYLCSAGVPTIGYGSTYYLDGRRVTLKDAPIPEPEAEKLLDATIIRTYLPGVLEFCPGLANEAQAAAVLDFCYNLGVGKLRSSTLRRKINSGDYPGAANEFLKWNLAAGRPVRGLTIRCMARKALFLSVPVEDDFDTATAS